MKVALVLFFSIVVLATDDVINTLTSLQTAHYRHIKTVLDTIQNLNDSFFFVEEDLSISTKTYLEDLSVDFVDEMGFIWKTCGFSTSCTNCFNVTTVSIEMLVQKAVDELEEHFKNEELRMIQAVEETKASVKGKAFLSAGVYEQFPHADAGEFEKYYAEAIENLTVELKRLKKDIDRKKEDMVRFSVQMCSDIADEAWTQVHEVSECVERIVNRKRGI